MTYYNKLVKAGISRRAMLRGMGAGVAASTMALPTYLRAQTAGTIKLGYLTPATGPLGLFGETDGYTVNKIREVLGFKEAHNWRQYVDDPTTV